MAWPEDEFDEMPAEQFIDSGKDAREPWATTEELESFLAARGLTPEDHQVAERTCMQCQRSIVTRARHHQEQKKAEERRREWQAEQQQRNEEYAQKGQQWQEAKAEYHRTYVWQEKRRQVLARAARTAGTDHYGNALCEGCHKRPARVVHHITYPPNCLPGSPEWIALEMNYQLKALCRECHENMTGIKYPYYG